MKRSFWLICLLSFTLLLGARQLSAKGWEYQESNTNSNLTAVSFVDKDHGWAVGEYATILATTDGGLNWKVISPPILDQVPADPFPYPRMCHFRSVYFLDERNGWVAGEMTLPGFQAEDVAPIPIRFGIILRTRDGGQTWECQYPCKAWTDIVSERRPFLKQINDIFFLNGRQGWAVGDGFCYLATEDGGETWKEKPIGFCAIPETRHNLTATRWISSRWGWVAGYQYNMFFPERRSGFIAHTEDGGSTWLIDPLYPVSSYPVPPLMDLEIKTPCSNTDCFPPPAWSVGEEGTILHLISEGWEHQGFPWPISQPLPQFNAVRFIDKSHGWIVGYRLSRDQPGVEPHEPAFMTIFHTAEWLSQNTFVINIFLCWCCGQGL